MNRIKHWATHPGLLVPVAALMIYTLLGFLVVPALVRHYTPKLAAEWLQRQASVGEVNFNPFRFTFEARNLALNEADGKPIFALGRLFLDFDPRSYFGQQAWVFADLRLEHPSVNLVLDRDGRPNLAKLVESLPKSPEPPPPDRHPPAFILKHFALHEGSLAFADLGKAPPLAASVEHLDWQLTDLSSLPDRYGNYRIEADLPDGGKLFWQGDVSLSPIASRGEVRLEAVPLASAWQFVKDRLKLAEPAGAIGLSTRYTFSYAKGRTDLALSDTACKLAGLRLARAEAKDPLLNLEEIGFERASFDLAGRTIRVPTAFVRKGTIAAAMDAGGELDWLALTQPEPQNASPKITTSPNFQPAPVQPWKLAVDSFEITNIGLRYADASRGAPWVVSVADFGIKLGAQAEVGAGAPKAQVDNLALHVNGLALDRAGRAERLFGWDSLSVEGGRLDLEKQEVAIQRAAIQGGSAALTRQANGTLHPLELFAAKHGEAPLPSPPPAASSGNANATAPAWKFALDEFVLRGFAFGFTDQNWAPPLAYNLDDIQVSVQNIGNDGKTPLVFDTGLKIRQGGNLRVVGSAAPGGDAAKFKLKLDRCELPPLQPVLARFVALTLESAALSTDLAVDFKAGEPQPSVKVNGGAKLTGLSLKEATSGKRFLAWKTLAIDGIDLSLTPDRLKLKEVRIVGPDAVIAIAKDKSTNIGAIVKPPKPAPPPPPAAAKTKTPPSAKPQPFPVKVGRVVVEKGLIDFSDMSLVLPFATHIHDFEGAVAGFSLAPSDRATLKFQGRVDDYGEVKVDGSLNPLNIGDYSNIQVVFGNIAMDSLSPYSATFAGRKIEAGKLNLDIAYQIAQRRLQSENKVVLKDFKLGAAVASPNAVSLPLDLAVALLTDGEGKIKAAVPITGSLDDPRFAYGQLVWEAFTTLITKVVAAPFNAIGSLLGGPDEKLDTVLFEAGKDAIPPPEREKLGKLAQALAQRPRLKLTVHGGDDPKTDGLALKSRQLRAALAAQLDVRLAPGEEPDAVAYENADAQRALEKLAAERAGPGALAAVAGEYLKATGRPAQRVGILGASATPDFYERLFQYLVDKTPLPDAELAALAERRGKAVVAELTAGGKVERSRMAAGPVETSPADSGGKVPVRLELGAE